MADEKKTKDESDEETSHSEESNVEERLAKVEKSNSEYLKALEQERKNSAGRDKKIEELTQEKKALQEKAYSTDKLLEIREQEQKEREAKWEEQRASEKMELEKLRVEQLKNEVISRLENFPGFLIDRVRGTSKEEIEADARGLANKWVKERDKVENVRKIGPKPKSGGGRQINITVEDLRNMSPEERKKWTYEQYSGKGRGTNPEADAMLEELSQS